MKKSICFSMFCIFVLLAANTLFQSSTSGNQSIAVIEEVKDFNRVVLVGRGNLHIVQSGNESLKIVGDQEALKRVVTGVKYGELVISYKKPGWFTAMFESDEAPNYYLSVKDLSSVTLLGSGNIENSGVIQTEEMSITIDGSGIIKMVLDAKELSVVIGGAGSASITGKVENFNLTIQGSGNLLADQLVSKVGRITVEGSGKAIVNVSDDLDVTLIGSGFISYKGKPKINKNIRGSGSILPVR